MAWHGNMTDHDIIVVLLLSNDNYSSRYYKRTLELNILKKKNIKNLYSFGKSTQDCSSSSFLPHFTSTFSLLSCSITSLIFPTHLLLHLSSLLRAFPPPPCESCGCPDVGITSSVFVQLVFAGVSR